MYLQYIQYNKVPVSILYTIIVAISYQTLLGLLSKNNNGYNRFYCFNTVAIPAHLWI